MKTTNDTLQLLGETPLYQIGQSNVYVKLEKYNVGGSVKDRTVYGMLKAAQENGQINKDSILVEATSGNTGIALAMLGAVYGLQVVIIMPESMSKERRELIKAYGAQLILTPKETGMKGALAKAEEILAKYPNALTLGQFVNVANPEIHFQTTAEEIFAQLPDVDVFVAGVGTGGTFTGVVRNLKAKKASVKAIAVEPAASPVISKGTAGVHKIQGIGAGFVPQNYDGTLADEVITVTDDDAIAQVQTFMRESGISIGISSGAAIWAAKEVSAKYPDKKIVVIAPDGVEKYLSMLEFDEVSYVEA